MVVELVGLVHQTFTDYELISSINIFHVCVKYRHLLIIIWHFSYHMSYQPETPILAQGPKARGLIWVEG